MKVLCKNETRVLDYDRKIGFYDKLLNSKEKIIKELWQKKSTRSNSKHNGTIDVGASC